jgi:phosphohistidine phosphatase
MELYVLRHGIAVDPSRWEGDDASRPLTQAGEQEVARVITALVSRGEISVERVLSSPLVRAHRTAEIAARILGARPEDLEALASGAAPGQILEALERETAARLMIIGHNPDLSMLVASLTASPRQSLDRCGIAHLDGELALGHMRRVWMKSPRDVLSPPGH